EPRRVRILSLELMEAHGSRLVFRVRCSKGTYVRTLVEDIAKAAGTVAHTAALHREKVGDFDPSDMMTMAEAETLAAGGPEPLRARLLPIDRALTGLGECSIDADAARRFEGGQAVTAPVQGAGGGQVRVYEAPGRFLGIGELGPGGIL